MMTIYFPAGSPEISTWTQRIDQLFVAYQLVERGTNTDHLLFDNGKTIAGTDEIDIYLDNLQQLVNGWYEDRCDRYEFNPDLKDHLDHKR